MRPVLLTIALSLLLLLLLLAGTCTATSSATISIPFVALSASSTAADTAKVCLRPSMHTSIASVFARKVTVALEEPDWDSARFTATVAAIILRDALGFDVNILRQSDQSGSWSRLAAKTSDANLEMSKLSYRSEFAKYIGLDRAVEDAGASGYIQQTGWFVPSSLVADNPSSNIEFWKSLKDPSVLSQLTAYGSTPPSVDSVSGQFVCNASYCSSGVYVPPACTSSPSSCKELLHGPPSWAPTIAAQLVKNLGLNLTIPFLNASTLHSTLVAKINARAPFLLQMRHPSYASVNSNFTRVALPEYSSSCYLGNTLNPSNGTVTCDFPSDATRKLVRSTLYTEIPQAYLFFRRLSIEDDALSGLLQNLSSYIFSPGANPVTVTAFGQLFQSPSNLSSWFANDSAIIAELACSWLRNNEDIWAKWLPVADTIIFSSSTSSSIYLAYFAAPILSALILCLLTVFLIRRNRRQRQQFKHAIGKQWTLNLEDISDMEFPDAAATLASYKHQRVILTRIDWYLPSMSSGNGSSTPLPDSALTRTFTFSRASGSEALKGQQSSSSAVAPQTPQLSRGRLLAASATPGRMSTPQLPGTPSLGVTQKGYSKEIVADFIQLKSLRHPNIVEFFGVTLPPKAYLVMEFMAKGSLRDMLEKSTIPLDMDFKASMALDIARGMDFLHSHKIPHKNLSSANVLVDNRFVCKITGFGLSNIFPSDLTQEDESQLTWVAPEVINWVHQERMMMKKFGHSTLEPPDIDWFKSDVFSFGYILFEMLIGGEGPEQRERRMESKRKDMAKSQSKHDGDAQEKQQPDEPARKSAKRKASDELELNTVGTIVVRNEGRKSTILGDGAAWKLYGSTDSLVDDAFLDLDPMDQRENDFLLLLKSCQDDEPSYRPNFSFVTRMLQALMPNRGLMENMASMLEIYSSHLEEVVEKRTEELSQEKQRAEALLHNILPKSIAEQLQRSVGLIANEHKSATVFFSDIVGFTTMSHNMPPSQVVDMLNHLFTEMDRLAMTYGLEKIKTIGDAYMAACGVPTERPDHVERVALFALKAIGIKIAGVDGKTVQMRMGIHTGPVTAGVVGTRKFAYDLWGDTVNTASRMESNGAPGRVCVSETVYTALADKFKFEAREPMYVKGLGETRTYFLIEPLPHFSLADGDASFRSSVTEGQSSSAASSAAAAAAAAASHNPSLSKATRSSNMSQETVVTSFSNASTPSASVRNSALIPPEIHIELHAGQVGAALEKAGGSTGNSPVTSTSDLFGAGVAETSAAAPSLARPPRTGRERQASVGNSVVANAKAVFEVPASGGAHGPASVSSNPKNIFIDESGAVVNLALLVAGKDSRPQSTASMVSKVSHKGGRPPHAKGPKMGGPNQGPSSGTGASSSLSPPTSGAGAGTTLSVSAGHKPGGLTSFLRKDGKATAMSEADLQKWRQIQSQRRPSTVMEVVVDE